MGRVLLGAVPDEGTPPWAWLEKKNRVSRAECSQPGCALSFSLQVTKKAADATGSGRWVKPEADIAGQLRAVAALAEREWVPRVPRVGYLDPSG